MSIQNIKDAVSLIDIAREYGEVRKSAGQWLMLCLWHSEQRPSLRIYEDHFYCYTCQSSGDVIDMVAKGEGVSKGKALAILSDRTGIPLDGQPRTRVQRAYDAQEREFSEWWQKRTIASLGKQLTAYCRMLRADMGPPVHYCPDCDCYPCVCERDEWGTTEEDCERVGALLRGVRQAKGVELRALAARAGNRAEWVEDVKDAEMWTWWSVEALSYGI